MPISVPRVLQAGKFGGCARRKAEHDAGERLEDQILRAIGQHRDEDENRKSPRLRLGPDFHERRRKRRCGAAGAVRDGCRSVASLDAPHTAMAQDNGRDSDTAGDRDQPQRRERIEHMAGDGRGHDEARDHHHPDEGRRRGAAPSARCAWPAAPTATCRRRRRRAPIRQKRDDGERNAEQRMRRHPRRRRRRRAGRRSRAPPCRRRSRAFAGLPDPSHGPRPAGKPAAHSESQPARPAAIAGIASSTTITRLSVEVVEHHDRAERRSAPGRAGRCRTSRDRTAVIVAPPDRRQRERADQHADHVAARSRCRCTRVRVRAGSSGNAPSDELRDQQRRRPPA